MGEDFTDSDKGCAVILMDKKIYKSTVANDKRIIGALSEFISGKESISNKELVRAASVISIGDSIHWRIEEEKNDQGHLVAENEVQVSSGLKISNENGDLEVGDLICTSSTPGLFMKQSDDIIRLQQQEDVWKG